MDYMILKKKCNHNMCTKKHKIESPERELNPRPRDYKSRAPPD